MNMDVLINLLLDDKVYNKVRTSMRTLLAVPHAQLYASATMLRAYGDNLSAGMIEDVIRWQSMDDPERTKDKVQRKRIPRERL
jgi:ABC-type uncharacterized transport system YnjBCD permease subunit